MELAATAAATAYLNEWINRATTNGSQRIGDTSETEHIAGKEGGMQPRHKIESNGAN